MQNHVLGGGPWSFILWSGTNLASDSPCHWRYVSCPWKRQNRHEIYCWKTMKSRIQKICKCLKQLAERMSFKNFMSPPECTVAVLNGKTDVKAARPVKRHFTAFERPGLKVISNHHLSAIIRKFACQHVLWKTAHMHSYWDMIAKYEMDCLAQLDNELNIWLSQVQLRSIFTKV